jgi:hypothetical protein
LNHLIHNITTWLGSLGTWGYVLTMAVPVLGYLLYSRTRKTPPPVVPTAVPSAATAPIALAGSQQLLNVLATSMGWVPAGTTATTANIPSPMLAKLTQEVQQTTQAQITGHIAALADLGHTVPAPAKTSPS